VSTLVKALCCTCGSIRGCRQARNHRRENYWFSGPIDLDWHRETGDLKCVECGRITTHALLHPDGDRMRDHAEMMQRVATGNRNTHFKNAEQLAEVEKKYRQGLPRNPYLNHFRYDRAAQEAWDAGRRTVSALCGEPMTLHRDPSGPSSFNRSDDDRQIRPELVRDQEYEDSDTGLWWTELDCVDCLRVWHLELLRQRREVLAEKMTRFLAALIKDATSYPKKIGLGAVESLLSALESAQHEATVTAEGTTQ
jgi:hypothetical protein